MLSGNCAAEYFIFKNKFGIADRLKITGNAAELTGATGLFFMGIIEIGALCNRFAVSDTGFSCRNIGAVFPSHSFHINIQMQLTHAFDNRVIGFGIDKSFKSRIFLGKSIQSFSHSQLRFVVFGHNGQRYNRLGHIH